MLAFWLTIDCDYRLKTGSLSTGSMSFLNRYLSEKGRCCICYVFPIYKHKRSCSSLWVWCDISAWSSFFRDQFGITSCLFS